MLNWVKFGIASAVSLLLGVASAAHAQISTTTLAASIDTANTQAYQYVSVFFTNYWYFVLGFLILIGVIGFGKRAVMALFR